MNLKEMIEEIQRKLAQWESHKNNAIQGTSIVLDAIEVKLLLESLEQSLRVIKKQQKIITELKSIIEIRRMVLQTYMNDSIETVKNKINKMEQEND